MDTSSPEIFLENLIKSLVDHPQDVKIVRSVDDMGVLLTLDLNPEDMGKVIGRKGATAKAIRTLLRVVGMKNQARVNLKINEPEGREPRRENVATSISPQEQYAADMSNASGEEEPSGADVTAEMDAALEDLKADF